MGEYVVVTTTESDEKGPRKPGTINGGFFQKTDDKPSQYPSVVIQVDDIKEHTNKIEEAGAKC
jgi:predicted enzyme related to lactoylglutathione lyase